MYLHLGEDASVFQKDIIGIFDLDTASLEKRTKEFLASCQKGGVVVNIGKELPKSFIVLEKNKKTTVYISPLNTKTLEGRVKKY